MAYKNVKEDNNVIKQPMAIDTDIGMNGNDFSFLNGSYVVFESNGRLYVNYLFILICFLFIIL